MEKMKDIPLQIDGHIMWESLPVRKTKLLGLMNEMMEFAPKLSRAMEMFKGKILRVVGV